VKLPEMKTGLTISALIHAALVLWGIVSFAARPLEAKPNDALPIDIISDKQFSEITKGVKNAPKDKPPVLVARMEKLGVEPNLETGRLLTKIELFGREARMRQVMQQRHAVSSQKYDELEATLGSINTEQQHLDYARKQGASPERLAQISSAWKAARQHLSAETNTLNKKLEEIAQFEQRLKRVVELSQPPTNNTTT